MPIYLRDKVLKKITNDFYVLSAYLDIVIAENR